MRALSVSESNCDVNGNHKRQRTNGSQGSFIAALLLLVSLPCTLGIDAIYAKTVYVNAIVPQSLRKNETTGFESVFSAEFGRFHPAPASNPADDEHGSLIVNLYRIGSPLCTLDQLDAATKKKETEQWKAPFGLLVDRDRESFGKGCTYVQQVRHVQELGAAAAVLVNDKCLCDDGAKCKSNSGDACEASLPILHDDGTGHDVQIPTVMLTRQDGKSIQDALKSSGVTVEMHWKPFRSEVVSVKLWHTPFIHAHLFGTQDDGKDMAAETWWRNMSYVMMAFQDTVEFSPQYLLLDGAPIGCLGNPDCNRTCTNGGRYCDASGAWDGVYHVEETLVRKCIWKHVSNSGDANAPKDFWDYVIYTEGSCSRHRLVGDENDPKECRAEVLGSLGIQDMVHNCMVDTGGIMGDVHNDLLAYELQVQTSHGPHLNPTITVNQVDLRYAHGHHQHPYLSASSVFEATCYAFLPQHRPEVCKSCLACHDPIACLAQSEPWSCDAHPLPPKKKRNHFRNFLLWCLFIGGMVFAANKYRRYKNEQNLEAFFQNNSDYTLSENLFGSEGGAEIARL